MSMILFRKKREKIFGDRPGPGLDRNARARLIHLAKVLKRPTKKGRHYGAVTAKDVDVLEALLWRFHNAKDGRTFPSYEKLSEAAGCDRSHIANALKRLEAAGLLTWVNRLVRIKERCRDLLGANGWRWRVIRTSNSYSFRDPQVQARPVISSKTKFQPGSKIPDIKTTQQTLPDGLASALARLGYRIADRNDGPNRSPNAPITA